MEPTSVCQYVCDVCSGVCKWESPNISFFRQHAMYDKAPADNTGGCCVSQQGGAESPGTRSAVTNVIP